MQLSFLTLFTGKQNVTRDVYVCVFVEVKYN